MESIQEILQNLRKYGNVIADNYYIQEQKDLQKSLEGMLLTTTDNDY